MPRNKIYDSLFDFKCEKTDDKTGKPCTGRLHPNKQYSSSMDFICHTCGKYTTMTFNIANLINTDTNKPPKKKRT